MKLTWGTILSNLDKHNMLINPFLLWLGRPAHVCALQVEVTPPVVAQKCRRAAVLNVPRKKRSTAWIHGKFFSIDQLGCACAVCSNWACTTQ